MASCRCRRNVYMLAVAFLCNFASYMTLESMQSSLNRGIGTTALCLLYAFVVVSSLFLPPLVIAKLDCRKSLTLSILSFASYTLANFYPKPYTLIPAAILLGMGSSVMWSCAFYYIIQLSQKHALEKRKCVDEVTGEFFGKFTAISHISILVGTLFMSIVFESFGTTGVQEAATDGMNGTLTTTLQLPSIAYTADFHENNTMVLGLTSLMATEGEEPMTEQSATKCGLYYKFSEEKIEEDQAVSDVVMYVLLTTYLAFNLVAALLCLCLDEVKGAETIVVEDAVCTSMSSLNGNKVEAYAINEKEEPEREKLSEPNNNEKGKTVVVQDTSAFKMVRLTLGVLISDKAAWLLIPFTLHYGIIQGFARGVYNASWVTCALGIKYVAYVTCMYAAVMIVSCYSFGKLLRYTTHVKIFICTMSFEIGIFVVLLLWQPNPDNGAEVVMFFAIPFGLAICHSSLSSQLVSVYSRFYPDNKKSGTALQGMWNPMGSAIAYGLSGPLYPVHMIVLVMVACTVGTLLYLVAEGIINKPYRKCPNSCC